MNRFRVLNGDRGDAGLPFLLITPALLFIVLHLINATQQLYERREAYSVAATAARVGNQPDLSVIRGERKAGIDTVKSTASIQNYVAGTGFTVVDIDFSDDRGDGTLTVTVQVEREVDYLFPIPGTLSGKVEAEASSVLNRGVTGAGTP